MKIVDLTLPLFPGMPGPPGDPTVSIVRARSHEADGYEVAELCLGTHSGTHLDAPRHFLPDGATLDQYSARQLVGPGVVIDCRPAPGAAAGIVDAPLLAERMRSHPVPSGGFALLWTEGAFLAIDAAQLLLDAGAVLVGTDGPSLDAEPYPVHRLLLGRGVLLAEKLCALDIIGPGPMTCAFLPLAVVGTDGAPVRAIAWR